MSWEETKPEPRSCPCGRGYYAVTYRSDDWGRFEQRWAMHCPGCATNYALYTYYVNRKGTTETYYGWVPKPFLRELAELRKRMEEEKRRLATYLETQYNEKWLQHFSCKTKKAVWSELTQNGRTYPSLTTFYSHIRDSGLEYVLKGYLQYRETETIIRVLELDDIDLTSMIEMIQKLEQATEQKEQHVRQEAVA